MKSSLEILLSQKISSEKIKLPATQYPFIEGRRFKADFAWLDKRLICEVEGGTWTGGRHVRGIGFEKDCEKYNLAVLEGWKILRFTGKMIKDGRALDQIKRALEL